MKLRSEKDKENIHYNRQGTLLGVFKITTTTTKRTLFFSFSILKIYMHFIGRARKEWSVVEFRCLER